jgi:hypothetical protein
MKAKHKFVFLSALSPGYRISSVSSQRKLFLIIKPELLFKDISHPDTSFHINADPNQTFYFNANADPDPFQSDENPRPLVLRLSPASF